MNGFSLHIEPPRNCYHVVVCVVPFNFICSMTMFRKSFILDSSHPLNLPRGSDPGIQSKLQSDIFHINCFLSVCIQSFGNSIKNLLSYCQIYVFDLWPCLKSKVGGVFIFTFTPSYLSSGTVLLYIITFGKCLDHYSTPPPYSTGWRFRYNSKFWSK